MSLKEFFAYPNIKQTAIEFLKKDGNFEALGAKNKKPFRAHINKFLSGGAAATAGGGHNNNQNGGPNPTTAGNHSNMTPGGGD